MAVGKTHFDNKFAIFCGVKLAIAPQADGCHPEYNPVMKILKIATPITVLTQNRGVAYNDQPTFCSSEGNINSVPGLQEPNILLRVTTHAG